MVIKSAKAIAYVKAFRAQCQHLNPLMAGDLEVEIDIFYRTRKPDLDESLILDAMQGLIYENDRQIKAKHIRHHISKARPQAIIRVQTLAGGGETGDQ